MVFLLPCPRRPPDREYQLWGMSGPGEGMTPLLLEVLWDKPCLQSLGVGLTDGSLLSCPGILAFCVTFRVEALRNWVRLPRPRKESPTVV